MIAVSNCRLVGPWRMVEAYLWARDQLGLVNPAAITIGPDDHGKSRIKQISVLFHLVGFDSLDKASSDRLVELLDDGSIEIILRTTSATRPC